jgi:predicted RNA-binding Zn ribbon-like protein
MSDGKRQSAPGELELVRDFVNTLDVEEASESLASPEALAAWLAERGLLAAGAEARPLDLRWALELREALRALLLHHAGDEAEVSSPGLVLEAAARRARLRVGFDEHGEARLVAEAAGVAGALGRLLAIVHDAQASGSWARLKACREHTCQWAFYDHTKNRSGRWCTMDVCGNRNKARAYRERRSHAA